MHIEPAARAANQFPHLLDASHHNCPNCGRPIVVPILDVHHDGSHCGYCASCRTEVFEADWSN